MFDLDSLLDVYYFKLLVLLITAIIAVLVGNALYEKNKDK